MTHVCLRPAYSKGTRSIQRSAIARPSAQLKMGTSFRLTILLPSEGQLFFPRMHPKKKSAGVDIFV
jgi:hypothetical protein